MEQQIPPHAAAITLGFPSLSYVPTTHTGVGKTRVLAPIDFFIASTPFPVFPRHPCLPPIGDDASRRSVTPPRKPSRRGPAPLPGSGAGGPLPGNSRRKSCRRPPCPREDRKSVV